MKIDLGTGHSVYLLNFSPTEWGDFAFAAKEIFLLTAVKHGFPALRSQDIYVFRNTFDLTPRYLSEPTAELLSVNAGVNDWQQFAYQLSHEASHLLAQNWRRYRKPDYYSWIEEALCGAHTIFCLRELSKKAGAWQAYGPNYVVEVEKEYPASAIDVQWFNTHKSHLATASTLTDVIKPLSRLIADEFPDGQFVADNMKLIDTPSAPTVAEYLHEWKSRCDHTANVPALSVSRLGLEDTEPPGRHIEAGKRSEISSFLSPFDPAYPTSSQPVG